MPQVFDRVALVELGDWKFEIRCGNLGLI